MKKTFKRILAFIPLFIILLITGVLASKNDTNTIKVIYPSGLVINLNTNKVYINDILLENNIKISENESYYPEEKIDFTKTIVIFNKNELKGGKVLSDITYDQIINSYDDLKSEKIVKEKVEIPFKTITRSAEAYNSNRKSHIIQEGENGLKEVTYKVTYLNDEIIEKKEISYKLIKKPIDKIVEISYDIPVSRGGFNRDLNRVFKSRSTGETTLTARGGVYRFNGRKETYYSSNVLYHYKTPEWIPDEEGFYRTKDGYYVVAASDMKKGTIFNGSKGLCIVLDTGCAKGTTDYYVNW